MTQYVSIRWVQKVSKAGLRVGEEYRIVRQVEGQDAAVKALVAEGYADPETILARLAPSSKRESGPTRVPGAF